jgi:hypothetical protein
MNRKNVTQQVALPPQKRRFVLREESLVMERGNAAAGGLGLRQPSAAFKVVGIKQSGTGVPHSKAAAPQSADGAVRVSKSHLQHEGYYYILERGLV